MMKMRYLACCLAMAAFMAPASTSAFAYTGEKLATNAKITIEEARQIALKAQPGTIAKEELEKERGGSGLRYSFDIKNGTVTYEVGVDGVTGNLLEDSKEGRHPD